MMVDHVLGRRAHNPGLRTAVDLDDANALAQSDAEYLVLHWNLLREFFRVGPDWAKSGFVAQARARLGESYGPPVVDNDVITVFGMAGARSGGAGSSSK
jgi:hypothetical protein